MGRSSVVVGVVGDQSPWAIKVRGRTVDWAVTECTEHVAVVVDERRRGALGSRPHRSHRAMARQELRRRGKSSVRLCLLGALEVCN